MQKDSLTQKVISAIAHLVRPLTLALFLSPGLLAAAIRYTVEFEGIRDKNVLRAIKESSQLIAMKKRPPVSLNALRYRAEGDVHEIIRILHSFGYYNAKVHFWIDPNGRNAEVIFEIEPGTQFSIEEYRLHYLPDLTSPLPNPIPAESLGIVVGNPALSASFVEAEEQLIESLTRSGYPLAEIEKKEYIVDEKSRGLSGTLYVKPGPFSHFGPVTIEGTKTVRPLFIETKIQWEEGKPFDSSLIEKTHDVLMDTHLFGSVTITPTLDETQNGLPIVIEVLESKHKSVNIGVSYQTFFGLGGTLGWENRNLGGLGRRFSFQADVTKRTISGNAILLVPDFSIVGQDLVFQAQAMHESITAYSMETYNVGARLEKKLERFGSFSIGAKFERLYVMESVDDGNFFLLEVPFYYRFSTANNLLNPTRGVNGEFRITPTENFTTLGKAYSTQQFAFSWYWPFESQDLIVLAQKVTLGGSISSSLDDIPVPKRFFGGSEEDLRGYKYKTVSPLDACGQPIGGRSAVFYSLELRVRPFASFGFVPFFDLGNVYLTELPQFNGKWLKSLGIGLRYFSFFGPFRLDVGFPLDRREGIDSRYRILVSVGQAF